MPEFEYPVELPCDVEQLRPVSPVFLGEAVQFGAELLAVSGTLVWRKDSDDDIHQAQRLPPRVRTDASWRGVFDRVRL
ncbi:hypothetical protein AB0B63_26200 [Micromonospora sp. NPDC049081]|uniref:hypothetical protein n=1 Tax=Micromonospora sp. NPDC049081 TaxID=3155150 RepID=UPI00340772C2